MLSGIYDIHVHAYPSLVPRKYSLVELVKLASEHHFAGILYYDHSYNTQPAVQIVNELGYSTKVYGSVMLNKACGGLSEEVVDTALKLGTKVISFPTYDAKSHFERMGHDFKRFPKSDASKAFYLLDENGSLLPEVERIIEMVAERGAVLASGHLSPEEDLAIARLAKREGVRAFIVNSVTTEGIRFSLEEQKALAAEGAYLEHTYMALTPYVNEQTPVGEIVEVIKEVGPERCLISTDSGQASTPDMVTGLYDFIDILQKNGVSESEIEIMVKRNPKYILEG